MDVVITTSDPDEIDETEIRIALEKLDYFVASITIKAR